MSKGYAVQRHSDSLGRFVLWQGDCRNVFSLWDDNSVDAIVTDPPYELGFMGKTWDASGIAYNVDLWREALRVLKPGGHLLAFGGSRTYHRLACAVEDAGFEIRDQIMWVYGSGFPKSLDVSKAIDKQAGAKRERVPATGGLHNNANLNDDNWKNIGSKTPMQASDVPATDAAKQWDGWGTALKPAHEPIVVARKPLEGTVAANVLKWGTGALNIDGTRVGTEVRTQSGMSSLGVMHDDDWKPKKIETTTQGRWPANFIHDGSDEVLELAGDAARFFYCAKASKTERNAGLGHLEERDWKSQGFRNNETTHLSPRAGAGRTSSNQNHHPTVKPIALMRYLIRLVTPPGGVVLDPFAGSGTTMVAALMEGAQPWGCEMTEDYIPIILGRIDFALSQTPTDTLFST